MAMKNFIDKILDMPKLIRRLWLLLWILLVILLVMKFCFGIWYPVVSNNEVFNNACKFLDENKIARYIVNYIFYFLNLNIAFLTCCILKKYKSIAMFIIINILGIIGFVIKIYNNYIGFGVEIIYGIIIPIIYLLRNKEIKSKLFAVLFPICIQLLAMIFQLNILLVRGLPNSLYELPMIIQIIMQLDYYIFIVLTWIGVCFMGLMGLWFWSNDVTQLKAIREKELKKAKPNMKKVESLNSKIAELEKEGK